MDSHQDTPESTPTAGATVTEAPAFASSGDIAPKPGRRWLKRLGVGLLACLLLMGAMLGGGWWELNAWIDRPHGRSGEQALKIAPKTSTRAIAEQLTQAGLISDPWRLLAWLKLRGRVGAIQAGEYRIATPIAPRLLLETLAHGRFERRLTIPEGWTARQIGARLKTEGWIAEETAWHTLIAQPITTDTLGFGVTEGAEGFCFPDTYALESKTPAAKILARMLVQFRKNWEGADPARRDERSEALSPREIVILASMVEREARLPEEMPLIAGVYLNRLKRGMKLQCCATVHYALGEVWGRALTYDDLKVDSPYNTYRRRGLPPGPIANPGRAALEAVLRPAPTDALFYVYRGEGHHIFSRTYAEHEKAVRALRASKPNETVIQQDAQP